MQLYLYVLITLLLLCFFISKLKPSCRKYMIIVNAIISFIYVIWRITTIPTSSTLSFALGTLLFIAELMGVSQFFIFQFLFLKTHKVERKYIDMYGESLPSVDVLICTYNESEELLEKTIIAALNMDYKGGIKTINVCDDGNRYNIKKLCEKYGVSWITRNTNEGAKAGNINNALNYLSGELFLVLDADMIPSKDFLEKTIGYFTEENVAFVQTPQCYYNQDMYQYNLKRKIPNEQDFFMRDIQEARAAINAVLHVGTNAVFRRKYIEEIGRYPQYSITEDMAVGLSLQSKGYQGVFINEPLVLGLSATTYSDLVKQRDRWCRGNLQVFKHFNPLREKKLSIGQKIAYLDGVLYWLTSIQKMVYILAPILFLITGIPILNADSKMILTMFIPFLTGQVLIFKTLSPNTRSMILSHIYDVAMCSHLTLSILKEMMGFNIKFNVTPKDVDSDKGYYQFKVALPNIILLIASIIALIAGTHNMLHTNNVYACGAYTINILWCIYNILGIVVSLYVAYQKPIIYSDIVPVANEIDSCYIIFNKENITCSIIDMSHKAIRLKMDSLLSVNKGDKVSLIINNIKILSTIVRRFDSEIVVQYDDVATNEGMHLLDLYIENIKPYYNVNRRPIYVE